MRHSQAWLCKDCDRVFTVNGSLKKRSFCPECGENVYTYKYEAKRNGEPLRGAGTKPRWTDEEIEVVRQCLAGKLLPYMAALQLGRPVNQVVQRAARMRRDFE